MIPKMSRTNDEGTGGTVEEARFLPLQCDAEGQFEGGVGRGTTQRAHSSPIGPVPRSVLQLLLLPTLLLGGLVLVHRLGARPHSSKATLAGVTAFSEQGSAIEVYELLGTGRCLNQTGSHTTALREEPGAEVLQDGSSPNCERACSAAASCTGYSTIGGKCHTLTDNDFLPSAADGTGGSACFWRHKFIRNTTGLYPAGQKVEIPKILWSYWEVRPSSPPVLLEFVNLCMSTWKGRNPGWEVRLLNETTLTDWLGHDDVPEGFNSLKLMLAHKADIIRLALLNKYGGVWLDATSLTIQPMDDFFGSHRERTFFNLPYPALVPGSVDQRVDWTYREENWILAAPPKDPFFEQITSCVWHFFRLPAEKRKSLEDTGMFTRPQLQMLQFLGIDEYVSTTACIFKVVNEDAAIASWYFGNRSRHVNLIANVGTWWWTQPALAKQILLETTNQTMLDTLLHGVPIFKFDHNMRAGWILPLTPKALWCKHNTLHALINKLGVESNKSCNGTQRDRAAVTKAS
jgi:hypothetical protein